MSRNTEGRAANPLPTMKYLPQSGWLLTLLLAGCGPGDSVERARELSSQAGRAIGAGAGTFVSSVGAAYEKAVTAYDVRPSRELRARGVAVSVGQVAEGCVTNDWCRTLSLYVINQKPVEGTLRIRLFSAATQEIGRATAAVALPADEARYVPFRLTPDVPLALTKFIELDLKKAE
jgi:hypothetical protein